MQKKCQKRIGKGLLRKNSRTASQTMKEHYKLTVWFILMI